MTVVGCRGQSSSQTAAKGAAASDGWSVHEDPRLRFERPPDTTVAVFPRSPADPSPEFKITPTGRTDLTGSATFVVGEDEPAMMRRDAAGSLLQRFVSDGNRALTDLRTIPMKAGSCVGFAAVSNGSACVAERKGLCHDHWWVAQCDAPDGKRYLYTANLGSTASIHRRPPEFERELAKQERILRSIEFKKGSS